ncbi:MAG: aa3-type cytochrome c oxidase subunit IV [Pseudomonadota bacterium]
MAEHGKASMDIREHEKTFAGFIRFVMWAVALIIAVLVFMALVNA